MNRENLPYRLNCEGYFLYGDNLVLVKNTGLGYLEFPGGGVEGDIAQGMLRETLEETGAAIADLREVDAMFFDWGPDWPKTEKQKARYKQYRGEEMHMFIGRVVELGTPLGDPEHGDAGWEGKIFMTIPEVVLAIDSFKPFSPEMAIFHERQLEIVKTLPQLLS